MADGARRRRRGGDGHSSAPRARLPATVVAGGRRLDSVRGHGEGSHVARGYHRRPCPANVTSGASAPDDGPVRWGPGGGVGWWESLEQPGRDRQVAAEVRERLVPAQQDRELVEPEAGPQRGRRPRDRRVPGSHSANAPRGWTADIRWPRIGVDERRVADGDRPDPSGLGRVAVPEPAPSGPR